MSWFWIVLVSELLCASLTLLPALTPEGKRGLWSLGGFTGSLLLLLLVCCLYTGGGWFPTAALGVLLGLSVVFLPFVLQALPLPEVLQKQKFSLYTGGITALLLLLLGVVALTRGGDWFLTAAVAILFGVGLVFGPVILKKLPLEPPLVGRKPLLYAVAETLLLVVLYGVVWLRTGGQWLPSAVIWTVFGVTVAFLPFLMKQVPLPHAWRRHKALVYYGFESLFLLLALAFEGWGSWFPLPGLYIAMTALALPWGWLGAVRYLPVGGWFRAAVGCFWTDLWLWLFPWLLDRAMAWAGWYSSNPYILRIPFDFTNWTDWQVRSWNIEVLVLLGIALLGAACVAVGLRRKKPAHTVEDPNE